MVRPDAYVYVTENPKGSTLLFSSFADVGYFIFLVRQNDPHRTFVVLRANKLLATSFLRGISEEKITSREQIYEALDNYGTCYVVLEDGEYESQALNWLREEMKTERFVLRKRIPIRAHDKRLVGVALDIYEYKQCGPPNLDTVLEMGLPLVNDTLKVRLRDILH